MRDVGRKDCKRDAGWRNAEKLARVFPFAWKIASLGFWIAWRCLQESSFLFKRFSNHSFLLLLRGGFAGEKCWDPVSVFGFSTKCAQCLCCSTFRAHVPVWGQKPSMFRVIYLLPGGGNWPECSTESTPVLEFCAEYSNTSELLWLVPLQGRKMPGNEWKFVLHLFYWKMHFYHKIL